MGVGVVVVVGAENDANDAVAGAALATGDTLTQFSLGSGVGFNGGRAGVT